MIIAGNCLLTSDTKREITQVINTAKELKKLGLADFFRCKIWGGGTSPERYYQGIGDKGIEILKYIRDNILIPTGTEIQIPEHLLKASGLSFIWVGARNCQNYALLESLKWYEGVIMIKRGFGITVKEIIGLYSIMREIIRIKEDFLYLIERGINTFDRQEDSRWAPDLKGVIQIKKERPDVFDKLIIDCSHSVGKKEYIKEIYEAFKSIGCKHFMFECSIDGKSLTDTRQMLSVKELHRIIKGDEQ